MTCFIEFLDTVTTSSQGWETLAAMLIKRRNFDRNDLDVISSKERSFKRTAGYYNVALQGVCVCRGYGPSEEQPK